MPSQESCKDRRNRYIDDAIGGREGSGRKQRQSQNLNAVSRHGNNPGGANFP